ncbi:glycogen debranching protein GlgX [Pseudoalteromonas phenolica]|uniref:GlgX-like protein n=1 Tax=Pseudoalteromonas phenolica TaxID=161398 RepID=A0A0S2K8S3_9GAMM|nr:glycogen debranching protein GlgX [Pseudoalteromonas phenolica]ALO44632.1 GlgX-like protein [Pseudoalteromonas phenolica]MBE0357666.1 glycogen operon protein [Pseudoalteromonas phenolica O-BC30]
MLNSCKGVSSPLGASNLVNSVNFAVYAPQANDVLLCIFDETGFAEIERISMFLHEGGVWSVNVEGLPDCCIYGYRVNGSYDLITGQLHNENKLLLDPYAKDLHGHFYWSERHFCHLPVGHFNEADNAFDMPKSKLSTLKKYEGIKPNIAWGETVIYECHVKGATKLNDKIPSPLRGKFLGLAHDDFITHLKNMGVNAIELLPVHSFISEQFLTTKGLQNYWGYNTLNFFTPHKEYLVDDCVEEFQQMVEIFHKAGIEVIIDVVFNHTAEAGLEGPTLSFKGLNNSGYYRLLSDSCDYINDTGCGNTINIDDPYTLKLILDSLRYWVEYYGVDGFRFDLASILGRGKDGFNENHAFFQAIHQDPILSQCKLIAEPWDIGPGGYQLGAFPSPWHEWNDKYRDTVRQFWQAKQHVLPDLAKRIHGSNDLFEHNLRGPLNSINFITSHDGFTLRDWVSYEVKNNLANGENNQDGHNENHSFNCGIEGETQDVEVNALRLKQQKNALITLFMSCGVPMIAAGTELCHSQIGNNNAYCQDNKINWLNWGSLESTKLVDFISKLIQLRNKFQIFKHTFFIHQEDQDFSVHWLDEHALPMDAIKWHDPTSQFLMCRLDDNNKNTSLLLLLNASAHSLNVKLPDTAKKWHLQMTSEPATKLNQIDKVLDVSAQSSWVFSANFEGNDYES